MTDNTEGRKALSRSLVITATASLVLSVVMTGVVVTGGDDEPQFVAEPAAKAETPTTATTTLLPPVVITVPGPVQVVQVPGAMVVNNNNVKVKAEATVVTPPPPPPLSPSPPPPPPPPAPPSEQTCGVTAHTDWVTVPRNSAEFEIPALSNDVTVCAERPHIINAEVGKTRGTVNVYGGTALLYTPPTDWTGYEQFTYVASDGWGNFSTATVYVSVN